MLIIDIKSQNYVTNYKIKMTQVIIMKKICHDFVIILFYVKNVDFLCQNFDFFLCHHFDFV